MTDGSAEALHAARNDTFARQCLELAERLRLAKELDRQAADLRASPAIGVALEQRKLHAGLYVTIAAWIRAGGDGPIGGKPC